MAEAGKCTFGTRMPLDIHMLNERIYREVRHFKNYKTYTPDFSVNPVTAKFYAAHDQLKDEGEAQNKIVDEFFDNIIATRAKGPRSKYPRPATENQRYGWYTERLVPLNKMDWRFYRPVWESQHTKVETIILMSKPKGESKFARK